MDLHLSLTRSNDAFVVCGTDYKRGSDDKTLAAKVKIIDATFYLRKQNIFPSLVLAHQKLLESGQRAVYPVSEGSVKFYTIPSGNQSFTAENVFSSTVPSRIVLGFVGNAAYNGSYSKHPFQFSLYDINYLNVTVNNVSVPMPPLNIDTERSLLPYWMLYTSLGLVGQNQGSLINRNNFSEGYGLFAFDLQKSSTSDDALTLERSGNVRIEIKLKKSLPEAVNLILYYELPKVFEIDQFRQMTC